MKKIELGQMIGILANIGVIAGIVFLAFELRQNTRVAQGTASQNMAEAESQLALQWLEHPDIVDSFTKTELTDNEVIRLHSFLVMFARTYENHWTQYQLGVVDNETFLRYENEIVVVMSFPRNRNWWRNIRSEFDPRFASRIDRLLAERPLIPIPAPDVQRSLFREEDWN